jgi:hypothetical protein
MLSWWRPLSFVSFVHFVVLWSDSSHGQKSVTSPGAFLRGLAENFNVRLRFIYPKNVGIGV